MNLVLYLAGFVFGTLSCYIFLVEAWGDVWERRWLVVSSVVFSALFVALACVPFFPFPLITDLIGVYLSYVVLKVFDEERHKFSVVFWLFWAAAFITVALGSLYANVLDLF